MNDNGQTQVRVLTIPIKKMKEIALKALKGNWMQVFFAVLIFYLIRSCSSFLDLAFTIEPPLDLMERANEAGVILPPVPYGGTIFEFLIMGPVSFGLAIFLLTFFRTKKCDNTLLFDGFARFGKTFMIFLISGIKVVLWSMLFIFPGIIAAVRYSMAYYISADHPEYSANQCINESKRIMTGNISVFILMFISFIGWLILASLPELLISEFELIKLTGVSNVLYGIIIGIPAVFVNEYLQTTKTVFYELLTGNLVVMNSVNKSK